MAHNTTTEGHREFFGWFDTTVITDGTEPRDQKDVV